MPKISVIIPVYNVEEYLPKCLDSVINQTLEDIEIICINDCSTDGSLAILQGYAKKDKRIKLIDFSQNHGVSYARNTGIEEASGDYIAFLDPDDWWELDLAEKAYGKIIEDKNDILMFAYNRLVDDELVQHKTIKQINDVISKKDYFKNFRIFVKVFLNKIFRTFFIKDKNNKFTQGKIINRTKGIICERKYHGYFCSFVNLVWDKVYKTSFIKDRNIKFPLNIHPTEDVLFELECFAYKPSISFIPECLYNYRIERDNSAMKKYEKLVINQIEAAYVMFNSDYYKDADKVYKKLCIEKIIGGIVYFCILTMSKKYSMQIYLPKMQEFIKYIKTKLPAEIITNNPQINKLIQFISIRQNIKTKKDINDAKSVCNSTCL